MARPFGQPRYYCGRFEGREKLERDEAGLNRSGIPGPPGFRFKRLAGPCHVGGGLAVTDL